MQTPSPGRKITEQDKGVNMLKAVITSALILGITISTHAEEVKQFPDSHLVYRRGFTLDSLSTEHPVYGELKKVVLTYDDGHISPTRQKF